MSISTSFFTCLVDRYKASTVAITLETDPIADRMPPYIDCPKCGSVCSFDFHGIPTKSGGLDLYYTSVEQRACTNNNCDWEVNQ